MRIKTKLTLGVGILFVMVLLMSVMGSRHIHSLQKDISNILVANYHSLQYSRHMLKALDEIQDKHAPFSLFEEYMRKQEANVTEIGEKEFTEELEEHFASLKNDPSNRQLYSAIRNDVFNIMKLNMEAIQRKSDMANETASSATAWIALAGSFCLLMALLILVRLPSSIANPIKVLTDSIKQISEKNYRQRVELVYSEEFNDMARSFNKMAEKLQEYDESNLHKLMFEKKRIEALVNNMKDPVIGLDEGKKILFVNDAGLSILGLKTEEVVGKFAQDISMTNDLLRSLIQELMVKPTAGHREKKEMKIFADNKESYFEKEIVDITITPTGEHEKRFIGHVIILNNITPFKELELAKTNFIATVSHELKTPVSSIQMSLQLMENPKVGQVNDSQKQLIESIRDDSNRILRITGELLSMSQVETGNIQLDIQLGGAAKIVEIALEAVKVQAEQKHVALHVDIDKDVQQVRADQEKTAWVLINFLTNAITYSSGQSTIELVVHHLNDQVIFSVRDYGKGIDKRYRDKIFDRYFQVPGSNKSGTGLGLAISKEFIEAQGGKISVESEIGSGSTFYFMLPSR